jgi:AAA family ATP:ADP antiporter
MLKSLALRLDLEVDELRRALALGAILAGIVGSYTLARTVRDAEFLSRLPATMLPYVLIGVGGVSVLGSWLFARATRLTSTWESLVGTALVVAVSLAAFGQLFRLGAPWVPIAFYLWSNLYGAVLGSQFWLFANSASNPREARRTFSLVGIGGILGGLLGGAIAAPLAHLWKLPSLLNGAALMLALAVLLVRVRIDPSSEEREAAPEARANLNPLRHSYVRWMALAALCSVVVSGVLDYQFKVEMQRRFTSGKDLASFLGLFYVITGLVALLVQAFATRWTIQRLGASFCAALLPAGLGVTTALTLVAPGLAPVTAGRVWDYVTRISIGRASGELFYFPLEAGLRRRAKSLIDAGLERLGDGLAGVVILLTGLVLGGTVRQLAIPMALLLVVWAFAWWRVRGGYVSELGRNLRRMSLAPHGSRVSLREASLLREMGRLLDSPYERVVLQGIDMLEENDPETLEARIGDLLAHRSGQVRARALRYARAHRLERFADRAKELIHDNDCDVQIQAIAFIEVSRAGHFGSIRDYLDSPEPRVRRAALLTLAEETPLADDAEVVATLASLATSENSETRASVADAIGRRPASSAAHDLLTPLLADPSTSVRISALRSAGIAGRRQHVSTLIEALGVRATEQAGRAALVTLGDRIVGTLGDYLVDGSVSIEVRYAIPRALGEIHTRDSVNALFRRRDADEVRLAYRVIKAANHLRDSNTTLAFPWKLVTQEITEDTRAHLFALVHARRVPGNRDDRAERLLATALEERRDQALNRIFRRLALLYSPQDMLAAYGGVTSTTPRQRGNAVEYLENALSPEHRGLVLPLVDDTGEDGRAKIAEQRHGIRSASFEQTLEDILKSDDWWLRACALYVAGTRRERTLLPLVESNLATLNTLVRETASWARLAIASG